MPAVAAAFRSVSGRFRKRRGRIMKAIPTVYKGRQYRSRLEARWAAMFDFLGWRYEYEPVDFNGWIPDFVITEAEKVFVEVKPVDRFPEDIADEIDQSGCDAEVLIVGMTVPIHGTSIGWLRGNLPVDREWAWNNAPFGIWKGSETEKAPGRFPLGNPEHVIGFCHEEQSFRDRITGFYDGGCYGELSVEESLIAKIRRLWAAAGNEVQWHKST